MNDGSQKLYITLSTHDMLTHTIYVLQKKKNIFNYNSLLTFNQHMPLNGEHMLVCNIQFSFFKKNVLLFHSSAN